jgi:predicted acetylornithine/succinylornithine family transaminase
MSTEDLLSLARAHMMPNYAPPPFVAQRGMGSILWDADGNEFLDFSGGIGVNALGHAHPEVQKAIAEQAGRLCHTSNMLYHEGYIRVCQRLCELSFGEQVYLANSGAEANEGAIKLARRHFHDKGEDRSDIISARASFHGRTLGAISATGQPKYQKGFAPLLPGVEHVAFGDLDAIAKVTGAKTAAILLEPIQGNAGVIIPDSAYLEGVRKLCDDTGALLILDEVQTGIGRTGKWFAYQHENIEPDIMTCAKALGGGLPLGAIVARAEVTKAFQPGVHASTFGGNPVACAAGLKTMEIIERDGILEHAQQMGKRLSDGLRAMPFKEVRARGLMVGADVNGSAKDLQRLCLEKGMLINAGGDNAARFLPALNCTETEIDRCLETLGKCLSEL